MAAIYASVPTSQPNPVSVQLQNILVSLERSAALTTIAEATRNAAAMSAPIQNTKLSQGFAQPSVVTKLESVLLSVLQIAIAKETESVVVTAADAFADGQCIKRVLAVNHSSCVLPILVKERAVLPTRKQGAVHLAAVVARRSFSIATIRW